MSDDPYTCGFCGQESLSVAAWKETPFCCDKAALVAIEKAVYALQGNLANRNYGNAESWAGTIERMVGDRVG